MDVVSSIPERDTSPSARLLRQVQDWPALRACRTGSVPGRGLAAGTRQIIHAHHPNEVELCLTSAVIERMRDTLSRHRQIHLDAAHDWIIVTLETDTDIALAVSLLSVSIQANNQASPTSGASACPALQRRSRPPATWSSRRRPSGTFTRAPMTSRQQAETGGVPESPGPSHHPRHRPRKPAPSPDL